MPFAPVQHSGALPSAAAYSQAFPGNVTAGNLLVVIAENNGSGNSITVPITNTGTCGVQDWKPFAPSGPLSFVSRATTIQAWWAIASGTGSCTVTMTWTATSGAVYVAEFSGASGLLQHVDMVGDTGGLATSLTAPALVTTLKDNLVMGYASLGQQGTPQSPWVNLDATYWSPIYWQPNVPGGTYTPNVTFASSTWANVMFALGLPGEPRVEMNIGA